MSTASGSSSRSAARRLIKELDTWRAEARDEKGIERLGPVSEDDLLAWEAVFNGRGVGGGYEGKFMASKQPSPLLFGNFKKYLVISLLMFLFSVPETVYTHTLTKPPHKQKAAGSSRSRSRPTTRCPRPRCAS